MTNFGRNMYQRPKRTWGYLKKSLKLIVISICANRSHGLVIHSLELENSFSRIAIRSLELDNSFSRIELSNSRERITIREKRLSNSRERIAIREN